MRSCFVLLSLLCSAACSGSSTASPPAPEPPAPEPATPSPAPTPAPPPSASRLASVEVEAAIGAYRAMVRAFNAHDADAYFGAYADTLDCFYGRAATPIAELRRSRLRDGERGFLSVFRLDVLGRTETEVVLLDRGFFAEDVGSRRQVMHEKLVVLRRDGDRFRVVAETGRADASCLPAALGLEIEPSPFFDGCRDAHRACIGACTCTGGETEACASCIGACEDGAIGCLGSAARPLDPSVDGDAVPVPGRRLLATDADVRRLVELTTNDLASALGDEPEELDANARRWLWNAAREAGLPLVQRVDASGALGCGPHVVPRDTLEMIESPHVDDLRCSADRARCVAWLVGDEWEGGEVSIVVHLFFEGPRLRATFVEETRPHAAPDSTALDRFASGLPSGWDAPCQPVLVGLVEDRVGADFWRVSDSEAHADDGGTLFRVERFCGADATRELASVGDDWSCESDTSCTVWYGCGNYCAFVVGDASGAVLSVSSGIDASPLESDDVARLRPLVQCGASAYLDLDGAITLPSDE